MDDIESLKARVQYLEETNAYLKKENDKLVLDNADLDKDLNKQIDDNITLRIENNKLKKENEEFNEANTSLNAQVAALEEKNVALNKNCDDYKGLLEFYKNHKFYDAESIDYVDDNQVFDAFMDNAVKLNLSYPMKELINFYASTKSAKLTILEGISGTGKSKLVTLFGKTLGLDTNGHMKMIPVSPSWTDDTDIMGFLDENKMEYKEASIGLVSFLKDAENHPDEPYLVCFDEMNLAKVEYYFAQFISVLENDYADRNLIIYNPNQEKFVKNAQLYPAKIKLGHNVVFCGTINVDESTYRLSDKVLDRACLIKLPAPKISDIDITVPENAKIKVVKAILADIDNKVDLQANEKQILNELNEVLTEEFARFGIAYRVVNQIGRFLAALPKVKGTLNRTEGLDRMIVQKILSKVRGTQEQISALVGKMDDKNQYVPGKIDACLNKNGVVTYKEVRSALEAKAKELKRYGYVG